jgi:hypothetical protein
MEELLVPELPEHPASIAAATIAHSACEDKRILFSLYHGNGM